MKALSSKVAPSSKTSAKLAKVLKQTSASSIARFRESMRLDAFGEPQLMVIAVLKKDIVLPPLSTRNDVLHAPKSLLPDANLLLRWCTADEDTEIENAQR
jgi:hypothetical protein